MSPSALADLFDELEAQAPGMSTMPRWMRTHLGYLSSHPATSARSAMFRQAGEELDAEDAAADAAAAPPPAAAKDD